MDMFLWIGSALGATLGFLHAIYLYRQMSARAVNTGGTGINGRSLYTAIWTFALWTIFGSYILLFWLIGSVARLPRGLKR